MKSNPGHRCCKSDPCSTTDAVCPKGNLVPAFMERTEQFNFYTSATKSDGGSSNAATIGGAVGGGVGAALLIGLLIWFLCRRKKQRKQQYTVGAVTDPADPNGREKAGATDSTYYGLQSRTFISGTYSVEKLTLGTAPPTYTSPNPNMYSDSPHTPKDGHYQYAHISDTPQELPGNNHDSLGQNRFSELPAESSNTHRYSELPDNAALRTAELESPQTSPQPLQTEFRRDVAKTGLGGDENTRH